MVLAIDSDTRSVIGFVTAISDGVLMAYITMIEVLPDCQGRGIGRGLMERMLTRLEGFYGIDLLCDAKMAPFYERFGLRPVTGMVIRNHERLVAIDAEIGQQAHQ